MAPDSDNHPIFRGRGMGWAEVIAWHTGFYGYTGRNKGYSAGLQDQPSGDQEAQGHGRIQDGGTQRNGHAGPLFIHQIADV